MDNKPKEVTTQQTPKQNILLDTNIMSRIGSSNQGIDLVLYLFNLIERGFGLAISNITLYELLRGNTREKEEKMLEFLKTWFRYYISEEVLLTAAQLDNILKTENIQANSVDLGDKFISATSILTGSLILTNNSRDFPWPFFQEVERKPIFYEENNKQKCFLLALLKPDIDMVRLRFNERP